MSLDMTTAVADIEQVMAAAGTLSNLYVRVNPANTTGSYTFTILKNGVATVPAVSCSIGAASSCFDTTNSAAFAAGDTVALQATPSSTPTNNLVVRWTARISP
jgi:hypothetical protein